MMQTFQYPNLLARGMRGDDCSVKGISFAWDGDWLHVSGTATSSIGWSTYRSTTFPVEAGKVYTLSVEFADGMPDASEYFNTSFQLFSDFANNEYKPYGMDRNDHITMSFDQATLDAYGAGFQIWGPIIRAGATVDVRVRYMLVEGTTPAAWAPAEGETLAGGGALMSANLWKAENVISAEALEDGIYACSGTRGVRTNVALDRLATNQTFHCGFSVNPGANDKFSMALCYRDAAGNVNYAFSTDTSAPAGKWTRVSGSVVVPSGMTVYQMVICNDRNASGTSGWKVTNPTLSLGSPVPLASSAHTPYATQDHLRSEYATKASLKVTSDAVTAEVEERGKLAGRVGTLESTSGTHASKLEQLATSIKSLVKGESTYTDPDGKSATSGIYSLVTQTRDSVTALFGQYTKTADLASTQAVKDAKKAGTDAASAASAAQSTADSLATMIREDATGITVGKSADGKTWSTGRTHMDEDSFDILDKAGSVLSSFGEKIIELGKNSKEAVIIMLGGLARIKATSAGVSDGAWCVMSTDEFISVEGYHASRLAAGYKDDSGFTPQGVAEVMVRGGEGDGGVMMYAGAHGIGGNSFAMSPNGYAINHPEYMLKELFAAGESVADLNACGPGVFTYNASTANRPTDYGVCLSFVAGSGSWLFQLALPTSGDPHWRRNINGAGWEGWWQWATS